MPGVLENLNNGIKQALASLLRFPPLRWAADRIDSINRSLQRRSARKAAPQKLTKEEETARLVRVGTAFFREHNVGPITDQVIQDHPAEVKALLEIHKVLGAPSDMQTLPDLWVKLTQGTELYLTSAHAHNEPSYRALNEKIESFISPLKNIKGAMSTQLLYSIILNVKDPVTFLPKLEAYKDLFRTNDMQFLADKHLSDNSKIETLKAFQALNNAKLLTPERQAKLISGECNGLSRAAFAREEIHKAKPPAVAPPSVNPSVPSAQPPSKPSTSTPAPNLKKDEGGELPRP